MPPTRVEFTDFSGGLSLSRSPSTLKPTELRVLDNYVIGPKGELMTRPPLLRSSSAVHPAQIFHLNIISGDQSLGKRWGLLIGEDGGTFTYYTFDNTGTLIPLTDKVSSASFDPQANISSFRYKKIFYVFGDGVNNGFSGVAVRCDTIAVADGGDSSFDSWPIGVPTSPTAPTVAPAAGGSLPAATYYCVVTFYNPRTGAESTAGAVSAAVTTAAGNLQIAWTNIPVASGAGNSQVQYRRLWRTLPNQTNEYYLVGTLANNSTTTFTDNVSVAAMGARVSTDPGLSSGGSGGAAVWRERHWLPATITAVGVGSTVNAVAYSKPGLPEALASDAFLLVGMDDNSDTVSCVSADDYLIVFKRLSLWRITGTGPSNFRVDRVKSPAGLADTYAYAASPVGVFFLGTDGYFYQTDGYSTKNISDKLGKLDLQTGLGGLYTEVQSILWPAKNWFMTLVYSVVPSVVCSGTITGIISDGTGPAAGAVGSMGWARLCHSDGSGQEGNDTQADVNGNFTFLNVPCGDYDLVIWDDATTAYRSEIGAATVTNGITTDVGTLSLTTLGAAPACPGGVAPPAVGSQAGSTAVIYVYDYVRGAWMIWPFEEIAATRPRPRCLNLGYNFTDRAPRMYVGGQTDDFAFVNYFDDDLFQHSDNRTDVLSAFAESITDTESAPARALRTKDFDAVDFGLPAESAFIVTQVFLRVEWPTSIDDKATPDANWPLEFQFTLLGNTNTDVVAADQIGAIATTTIDWSTEDRANGQWHALGLSSQKQATTSIGLEIASAVGASPRRHSITGIGFEVTPVSRHFIQPGSMLTTNITTTVSGTVSDGVDPLPGAIVYLCPDSANASNPNRSVIADGSGVYSFTLIPGDYSIAATNSGNTLSSPIGNITVVLGQDLTHNVVANIGNPSSGCPG